MDELNIPVEELLEILDSNHYECIVLKVLRVINTVKKLKLKRLNKLTEETRMNIRDPGNWILPLCKRLEKNIFINNLKTHLNLKVTVADLWQPKSKKID